MRSFFFRPAFYKKPAQNRQVPVDNVGIMQLFSIFMKSLDVGIM